MWPKAGVKDPALGQMSNSEEWRITHWTRYSIQMRIYVIWKKCVGEGTLPWAIFRLRIFLNYSQKFDKIKIKVWKSDNFVWKFLFTFVLFLLHIKSGSKKIFYLAQGRGHGPCLGPNVKFRGMKDNSLNQIQYTHAYICHLKKVCRGRYLGPFFVCEFF